jgi:hypothetical protein
VLTMGGEGVVCGGTFVGASYPQEK